MHIICERSQAALGQCSLDISSQADVLDPLHCTYVVHQADVLDPVHCTCVLGTLSGHLRELVTGAEVIA